MPRCLSIFIFSTVLALSLAQSVFAVSNEFNIKTQVGSDTTPPTTPVLTSATPVSDDQIDIVWGPVTDDYLLSGYVIERNGAHIATTTLTSYSDTGLAASTTYSYVVRAFDWVYNFSSSSNALATTTLETPVVPIATTSSSSTSSNDTASGRLSLRGEVNITTVSTRATLEWETNRPSRYVLRWGRTPNYEIGSISVERYSEQHKVTISDLIPNTTYYYELVTYNPAAPVAQSLASGKFKTKPAVLPSVPPNVGRLKAEVIETDVVLSWQNPDWLQPYSVRVVRSHLGYPTDPYDGVIVAQGSIESIRDPGALRTNNLQYYTVFVVDENGNVSSGALVLAKTRVQVNGVQATSGGSTLPEESTPDLVLPLLSPHLITLSQDGTTQTFESEVMTLDPKQPLTLIIPVSALPDRLKSIIVTLTDPTDSREAYRFLLRRNPAGDAYETTLAPLGVQGTSQLLIEIYDLEALMVGRYGRQINFVVPETELEAVFPDAIYSHSDWLLWPSLGFILVALMWWVHRRFLV